MVSKYQANQQNLEAMKKLVTQPPVENETQDAPLDQPESKQEEESIEVADPQQFEEVTTQAPVVHVSKKPLKESKDREIDKDGYQLSVFANRCLWIAEQGTAHEKHVLLVLQNYVKVGLVSVNLNDIAIEQQRFWRLFEYIHNQPTEFQKLFGLIVEFAKEYKDSLFSLSMLFRAQSGLNLSVDQLVAFNNLRTLVLNTVQTNDLSKVKTLVDIRKIVEHDSIPEHIRGMYVGYYS